MSVANPLSIERERMARLARTMRIAEEYRSGEPIYRICRRYNVAAGTVCNIARKFGILKRNGCIKDVRDHVLELYKSGMKCKDIVLQTGIDRKTIWVIAREANLSLRRERSAKEKRKFEAKRRKRAVAA